MAPGKSLEEPRIIRKGDPEIFPSTFKMVAPRGKCPQGQPLHSAMLFRSYRCPNRRLEHSIRRSYRKRYLVPARSKLHIKYLELKSSLLGPFQDLCSDRWCCTHSNRQHHSGCLHKQGLRHWVGPIVCPM